MNNTKNVHWSLELPHLLGWFGSSELNCCSFYSIAGQWISQGCLSTVNTDISEEYVMYCKWSVKESSDWSLVINWPDRQLQEGEYKSTSNFTYETVIAQAECVPRGEQGPNDRTSLVVMKSCELSPTTICWNLTKADLNLGKTFRWRKKQ